MKGWLYLFNYAKKQNSLNKYDNDFAFIVNGEEFKTSRVVSDLLSPKIAKYHSIDPTIETFTINTANKGHFELILNLINFIPNDVQENEIPFISEVIEILENESIQLPNPNDSIKITEDNVFKEISKHEKFEKFYSKRMTLEIEFISSNFFEFCEKHEEELSKLKIETLIKIVSDSKLKLRDEDLLLNLINNLYVNDDKFSVLYEFVNFTNASSKAVSEFVDVYNINDVTQTAWNQISLRLKQEISKKNDDQNRYKNLRQGIEFPFQSDKEFKGIINYLYSKSSGNIEKVINFTASSNDWDNNEAFKPRSVALFNQSGNYFVSGNHGNEWICLDFKEHKIIPTHYTIRSSKYRVGNWHPKSWVVEASNDNKTWTVIDQQQNCSYLNVPRYVHTFNINKQQNNDYQYIRLRQFSNCRNSDYLAIEEFEIYGSLI